jgi:hypothetical protein
VISLKMRRKIVIAFIDDYLVVRGLGNGETDYFY